MSPEGRRLDTWEEAVGLLNELEEKEGFLFAKISKVSLILPVELEEKMRPYIGKRVCLLRTDILGRKQYVIRVIPDQEPNSQGGA
jgi:hypothetical protein